MHFQQGIADFHAPVSSSIGTMDGHYQAQVIGVLPKEHAVMVMLPALTVMNYGADKEGLKVSVLARRAGNYVGEVDLPRVGDWGVVVFLQGSHSLPVWLGSLYQTYAGLQTGVAGERLNHHDSGVYSRVDPAGNVEWAHPSGLYVRIGEGTTLTPRTRKQRKANQAASETVPYAIPVKPTPTVYLDHPSGTTITIATDGKVTVQSPDEVSVEAETVNVHGETTVSVYGDTNTHIGAAVGINYVVLLQALIEIKAIFDAHIHGPGGDPPTTPMPVWTSDVHMTSNTKAS